MTIAVLVLAAGRGRRFGPGGKLTAPLRGRPLLAWTLAAYGRAVLAPRILVTARADGPAAMLGREAGWQVVGVEDAEDDAPAPAIGIGHSLARGARALQASAFEGALSGILVGLGDMPAIRAETIATLVDAYGAAPTRPALRPVHKGVPGHPVVFNMAYLPALAACAGDVGARAILKRLGSDCSHVGCDDPGVLLDVDQAEDLERVADLLLSQRQT